MSDCILQVESLTKTFVQKESVQTVLADITMSVGEREIVGIMGPSGSGKTTLLKVLGGMLEADAGRIELFGTDCTRVFPQSIKRRIGFIYQESNLLPWRSVEGNLRLPLEMFHMKDEAENRKNIDEALRIVGLSDYRNVYPQELSGGMMQRVGIARALVFRPELLLMDQPFGALDALTRKRLRLDFLRIFEQSNRSIVIVTNSIDEALLFSNRILILSQIPACIEHEIEVDIPLASRTKEVAFDPRFADLRRRLIDIISAQYRYERSEEEA